LPERPEACATAGEVAGRLELIRIDLFLDNGIGDPTSGDEAKMLNVPAQRMTRRRVRTYFPPRLLLMLAVLGLLAQTGCPFGKPKAPAAPKAPAPPIRVAFLPLNVPQGDGNLHWIAVAAAVASLEIAMTAPDIEPVPLWESMPAALQSLGNSRTVTEDIARTTAARLSAKWSTEGDIRSTKNTTLMRLDFIPSNPNQVPFRYEGPFLPDKMGTNLQEAYTQFLRYLIARPLQTDKKQTGDGARLKSLAQAVDAEYGWYSLSPKPGGALPLVEELARTKPGLAKLLFSPTLYPVLAK
jgi:hypothetical protein